MIVQAIALLDDLDKEINIYAMRVKVGNLIYTFYTTCEQYWFIAGVVWVAFP